MLSSMISRYSIPPTVSDRPHLPRVTEPFGVQPRWRTMNAPQDREEEREVDARRGEGDQRVEGVDVRRVEEPHDVDGLRRVHEHPQQEREGDDGSHVDGLARGLLLGRHLLQGVAHRYRAVSGEREGHPGALLTLLSVHASCSPTCMLLEWLHHHLRVYVIRVIAWLIGRAKDDATWSHAMPYLLFLEIHRSINHEKMPRRRVRAPTTRHLLGFASCQSEASPRPPATPNSYQCGEWRSCGLGG
jgi:hypothetical protein